MWETHCLWNSKQSGRGRKDTRTSYPNERFLRWSPGNGSSPIPLMASGFGFRWLKDFSFRKWALFRIFMPAHANIGGSLQIGNDLCTQ